MRLSLSSSAAPDAALADLVSACARRGLTALELVEGDAHGVSTQMDPVEAQAVRGTAEDEGIKICALYRAELDPNELDHAAQVAAALGAPLVVPGSAVPVDLLAAGARAFAAADAELLLAHGSDLDAVEVLRRSLAELPHPHAVGLAWEVRPDQDDPAMVSEVLEAAGSQLRYVRLYGGGPEAAQQTGRGVGALMARLTLGRYGGPLVLTPSTSRYSYVWRAWLGRAGGWGCGSKQSDPALVVLE